jgi:hypothetical protein
MFRLPTKLFRTPVVPKEPFVDKILGPFAFQRGLGWKKQILLGGKGAELVLGSEGEPPSDDMLQTARSWIDAWPAQFPKIIEYIRHEFPGCAGEPNLPAPEKFEVESINILWRNMPGTSMIYFHYPGDDVRRWHVTFHRFEPSGVAYDD